MTIKVKDEINPPVKIDVRTSGEKRRDSILSKDPDFYKNIGKKGGNNGGRPFRDIPGLADKAIAKRWNKNEKENMQ